MGDFSLREAALRLHRDHQGKLTVQGKMAVRNAHDLSLVYTPGVAEPCKEIHADPDRVYDYTVKGNLVAVVTNGTAVLGLGNIGPEAALPVMEGKALLFKLFADVDAVPICVREVEVEAFVEAVKRLEPTFGGFNLEDIAAPACFAIEERLKTELRIPVFHDDQHGTAIVTAAGLLNALRVVGKSLSAVRVVVNGAGAAGIAVVRLLLQLGVGDVVLCDRYGALYPGRPEGMNAIKAEMAAVTNRERVRGTLADCLRGADVFIGVSTAGVLTSELVRTMARDAIVFAMANPVPEILPDEAKAAGAAVVGTGRSDFPNQVNNVLAFPGVFRGALDVAATEINDAMKLAAVKAIAGLVGEEQLSPDCVIPSPLDRRVAPAVAAAVAEAAMRTGVARKAVDPEVIRRRTTARIAAQLPTGA